MTNFIPIFPLAIVVYPGEDVNLHIFEPRYKQLIGDCFEQKKPFGIPSVINNAVSEMGTLVEVKEITNVYENGELDIKSRGKAVFRVLEMINEVPDKLYSGAIVNYPDNDEEGNRELMRKVVNGVKELHKLLNVTKTFRKPDDELNTYDVAHHAGLTLEEEYEFLGLLQECRVQNVRVLPNVVSAQEFAVRRAP